MKREIIPVILLILVIYFAVVSITTHFELAIAKKDNAKILRECATLKGDLR
jgi:hypothetical protein